MGKIGEEITQKIKSAVKAKLIELGVEIDNELPDYIMVLVANKKSQENMIKDLQLFLGPNTAVFTAWLHNVLKKLEEVTVSSRVGWKNNNNAKNNEVKTPNTEVSDVKTEPSGHTQVHRLVKKEQEVESDTDCLEINASGALFERGEGADESSNGYNKMTRSEDDENFVSENNTNRGSSRSILLRGTTPVDDVRAQRDETSSERNRSQRLMSSVVLKEDEMKGNKRKFGSAVRSMAMDREKLRREAADRRSSSDLRTQRDRSKGAEQRGSRNESIRRRSPPSEERRSKLKRGSDRRVVDAREILKKRVDNSNPDSSRKPKETDFEINGKRKSLPSVAKPVERRELEVVEPRIPSLVKVTPRPIRRGGVQPNKKLLLKAVADAEKSVASVAITQKKRDLHIQEKEEVEEQEPQSSSYIPPEKIFITLQNPSFSTKSYGEEDYSYRECSTREPSQKQFLNLYEETYEKFEVDYEPETQSLDEQLADSENWKSSNNASVQSQSQTRMESSPKCIITLGNSSPEKSDEWDEEMEVTAEENQKQTFEWNRLGPPPVAAIKPLNTSSLARSEMAKMESINKALERCRFWPNCLDKACIYYHPSSPCKLFPLCKYGNQCLFIHPDCKFGSNCFNLACNYLHRNPLKDDKKHEVPQVFGPSTKLCTYFPNCTNPVCKFRHPIKVCKFGKACARSDCYYFHPKKVIPPKELLSWKAK